MCTQHTILNIKKENHSYYSNIIISAGMGFSKGLKDEFETAMVNEPSVFEPLKLYCTTKRRFGSLFTHWNFTTSKKIFIL